MEDWAVPGIQADLCTACQQCVQICPENALIMLAEYPTLRPEVVCTYCGLCEEVCPTGAISLSYEIVLGND
jgi:formate hydrogenlyase subunit 6/NADH:ubiquinone oxidoreductase subunit I